MLIRLPDAAETVVLGQQLASPLSEAVGPVAITVHLKGPLGAGKTTLARGLLRGLGHAGRVRSPSFTLLESYELANCKVFHLDLYRLAEAAELDYLGIADLLEPGSLLLVEWPERGGDRLPAPDVCLALDYEGEGRRAACQARTQAGRRVLDALSGAREPDVLP